MVLHTENPLQGGDRFYGKLEDLENELEPDGFLRIQKSYLVNMAHIKKLNYDKVALSNGEELPASQKRYAQIKIQYLGWKINNGGPHFERISIDLFMGRHGMCGSCFTV